MLNKLLNKLERRFGRFGLPNLMTLIVFGMALVFLIDTFLNPDYQFGLNSLIYFDRSAILHGQVWRLLTFIFSPPDWDILFIVFVLYFYWMIGSALESQWGTFRFNCYYLIGMIGTVIAGMITGYATNYYLNLSLFLAFAMLYPNHEILLFFFIPVKMKFLAWLDGLFLAASFFLSSWPQRIAILMALLNFLLFFGGDLVQGTTHLFRRLKYKLTKRHPGNKQSGNQSWKNHWWDDKDNDPFK